MRKIFQPAARGSDCVFTAKQRAKGENRCAAQLPSPTAPTPPRQLAITPLERRPPRDRRQKHASIPENSRAAARRSITHSQRTYSGTANGKHARPRPGRSGKGRATKQHCDTPAVGSESEGVRRLRVKPQRTQRAPRSADAAVIAPVRRLCGRAMLAGTCRSERLSNPRPVRGGGISTGNQRSNGENCRAATRPSRPARRCSGTLPSHRLNEGPARPEPTICFYPGKFARRCAACHHTLSKNLLGNG